jgi:predicted MPP superfamily phosphohydrolase
LQKIVDYIADESGSLLLIGGDVSSDATVFEIFVRLLKKRLSKKRFYNTDVVFVLGNHELWGFSKNTIEEIVAIYRGIIEENGMFLLHNELIYENTDGKLSKVPYESIMAASIKELRELMKSSRLVILGGLGFAGYNQEFNANQGIYRKTLDRAGEVFESKKFEELYAHVMPAIIDKNTVVFTHTPKKDWCTDPELQKDIVYLSGHTHRNEFYDDGDYRLYSDNQVGYRNENPHLKSFLLNNEYDCFSDYADGIYEISSSQYNDFYRGKNIQMNFTREVNILYMLKKNGYYCFIHESKKGVLSILNGVTLKRLDEKNINYYFLHMDEVISYIRGPLDKYMEVMKRVSEEIRRIGGYGTIHGCIVDIDWYNHIYVNPVDLTITGYWALNIVDKIVYPNVPELLKVRCPEIYANYLKLIGEDKENVLMPVKVKNEVGFLPEEYLSTDIYKASREIKKMQKLESNILSSWYENPGHTNEIEKK